MGREKKQGATDIVLEGKWKVIPITHNPYAYTLPIDFTHSAVQYTETMENWIWIWIYRGWSWKFCMFYVLWVCYRVRRTKEFRDEMSVVWIPLFSFRRKIIKIVLGALFFFILFWVILLFSESFSLPWLNVESVHLLLHSLER